MPRSSIKPEDRVRLQHMLDAAVEIRTYTENASRTDLTADRKLAHSLVRLLEIVGEAASQVSSEMRAASPALPWEVMIGMRNRLAHAYFSVNLNIVWTTAVGDIPPLITNLQNLLGVSPRR
jgi:uncharacterized protein with HEPN domain